MFEPESHINGDDGYDSGSDEDDTISTAKKQKPPPESKHVSFWTASLSAAIARVGGDTATFMATMQELVTHGLPTITKGARWPTPQSSYVKDMLTVADKIRKSRQDVSGTTSMFDPGLSCLNINAGLCRSSSRSSCTCSCT
jgi:hypothetical protein